MTANDSIDPARFLSEHLERAEPDALCGAPVRGTHPGAGQLPQRLGLPRVRSYHWWKVSTDPSVTGESGPGT